MSEYNPSGESGDGVECPTCGRVFSTRQGRGQHYSAKHGEKLRAEVDCAWCGKSKRVKLYRAENRKRHFCDDRCEGNWRAQHQTGENAPRWEGGDVTVECDWCGSGTETPRHRKQDYDHHFCDRECKGEWWSANSQGEDNPNWESVETECVYCGETLVRPKGQVERAKKSFCDFACKGEWRAESGSYSGEDNPSWKGGKVAVECAYCGDENHFYPSRAARAPRHFCPDKDCHGRWRAETIVGENHHQWEGGDFPYGEGWNEAKRESVRERDGRECRVCGVGEKEHIEQHGGKHPVHHIVPARQFDNPERRNAMPNLITLCRLCHPVAESMAPLLPSGIEPTSAD